MVVPILPDLLWGSVLIQLLILLSLWQTDLYCEDGFIKTSKSMSGDNWTQNHTTYSLTWPFSMLSKQTQWVILFPMKIFLLGEWIGHIVANVLSFMTVKFLIVNQYDSLCFLHHSSGAWFVGIHSKRQRCSRYANKIVSVSWQGWRPACGPWWILQAKDILWTPWQPVSFFLEVLDTSVSLVSKLYYLLPRNIITAIKRFCSTSQAKIKFP